MDKISDLLTRIRNAQLRKKEEVIMPTSKLLEQISSILKEEGYINDFEVKPSNNNFNNLHIQLKYDIDGEPAIKNLKRVSKPGIRIYVGYKDLKPVLNNLGIGILSTPKGVITHKQAITDKVGGEYLCTIW